MPFDSTNRSVFITELRIASAFNHWAFKFLDANRNKWRTFKEFNKSFNVSELTLAKFANYAEVKLKVKRDEVGYNRSKRIIKNRIKAEIARHLFKENGYYQIYLKDDLDVQTALKELN